MRADAIFETCLYADDLDAAVRFYRDVFGLEVASNFTGRGVAFRCGDGVLIVFDPRRTRVPDAGVPAHGASGAGHVAFRAADRDLPAWREHLQQYGVAIETEVQWPEGGRSIYVRDPAGNSVELAPPTLWRGAVG